MSASRHGTQIFLVLLLAMLGRSAEAGRPVLDLANPPDGKGRFELSLPSSNLSASGYWWKRGREDGYTTFQIDEKLVDAAIGSLLSERKRYEDFDPRLVLLQQGLHAGNEYQFTLQDVLALVHVLPDMGSGVELLVAEAGSSCRDALREARTRVDDAVDGLRPSFVSLDASRQEWRLPLDRLGPDLVAFQKVVETDCNSNGLGEIEIQDRSLRFERVLASGKRRLSVYDTRAPGEPSGERLVAEMVIWKDGAMPPPPADPAPTSVVDPVAIFRLKVPQARHLACDRAEAIPVGGDPRRDRGTGFPRALTFRESERIRSRVLS